MGMFDDTKIIEGNFKLLYAEDEPELRQIYTSFFKNYFADVCSVEDGEIAFEKFKEFKPDVVILDILMPGLNGVEVATKIREIDKHIPIIIMTANDTREWALSSIKLGLTEFIKKGTLKVVELEKILIDLLENIKKEKRMGDTDENSNKWFITPAGSNPEIYWDRHKHELYKNGVKIDLSKKPTQVIRKFSEVNGKPLTFKELADEIWGNDTGGKTSTDTKIRAFIHKINTTLEFDMFVSKYGVGYFVINHDEED